MHIKGEYALVDIARFTLGTADGHLLSVFKHLCRIDRTDHGRQSQFTADDGCMTGTPALVGNDGGCYLHHRFPVRCGDVGDKHFTGLEAVHLFDIVDDMYFSRSDLGTDGTSCCQYFASLFETV